jgi:uncharacterized membrane protein
LAASTDKWVPKHAFCKTRMEALSDGVFSVALTLLIVDLSSSSSISEISKNTLYHSRGAFASFLISVLVVGMYWVAHHNEFNLIERPDRPFLWLNLLFLITIVCIPFSAAYLGKNWPLDWAPDWEDWKTTINSDFSFILQMKSTPLLCYLLNLLCSGLMLQALWFYASKVNDRNGYWRLKDSVGYKEEKDTAFRNWIIPIACLFLLVASILSPRFGALLIVAVPLIYAAWTLREATKAADTKDADAQVAEVKADKTRVTKRYDWWLDRETQKDRAEKKQTAARQREADADAKVAAAETAQQARRPAEP